ncbi:hypothetical protein GY45DRAFT_113417 [Cubamyces sp. BRFM 1775]|nr:hypothetical protein GY45DRAFT_113417 [Cubamyces sp. BRFM 1775]
MDPQRSRALRAPSWFSPRGARRRSVQPASAWACEPSRRIYGRLCALRAGDARDASAACGGSGSWRARGLRWPQRADPNDVRGVSESEGEGEGEGGNGWCCSRRSTGSFTPPPGLLCSLFETSGPAHCTAVLRSTPRGLQTSLHCAGHRTSRTDGSGGGGFWTRARALRQG